LGEARIMARVGYGLQEHPSQFLAVLAQSRVPAGYEIRVGQEQRTMADLVEFEKLACRSGGDLSLTLVGLSYYVGDDATWKNQLGETWSLERMLEHELDRAVSQADCDVTNRFLGISCAVGRRLSQRAALDGQYARAQKYLTECQEHALSLQNPDGSWHPGFLAYRGTSPDLAGMLRSTGHILEWLALSLPDARLEDPRVVKSASYLTTLLENRQAANAPSGTPREIGALMHAAHTLMIYDQRMFKVNPATDDASAISGKDLGQSENKP